MTSSIRTAKGFSQLIGKNIGSQSRYIEHLDGQQSVGHLTRKSEVLVRYPVWPHTFVSPSADSRGQLSVTGESMCTKYWLTA